jgi:periplasmic protein CpxP/Spy
MKPVFKSIVVAGLLATAGFAAYSQASGAMGDHKGMMSEGGMMHHGGESSMGRMDPAKMDAALAKRNAELKAKLKITATQEGAWTAYTAALKMPANMMDKHPDRAEMDKLTTPERIDKMKSLRSQHMADMLTNMDKRDEATKTFYATLSAEQKKTFDAEHARMGSRHGSDHGPRHGSKDVAKTPAAPVATATGK